MLRAGAGGVLLLLFGAMQAGAQITTYVAPARPATPSAGMIATADSARRDSVARAALTNMKEWVDSAAGVVVPSRVGDTLAAQPDAAPVGTFSDGSVAPATASDLPALILLGGAALMVGAALLAHRPRG